MEKPESVSWEFEGPVDFFKQLAKSRDIPKLDGKSLAAPPTEGKASAETIAIPRMGTLPSSARSDQALPSESGSMPRQPVGLALDATAPRALSTGPPLPPGPAPTVGFGRMPPLPSGPLPARIAPPLPPGPPPLGKHHTGFVPPLPPGPPPAKVVGATDSQLPYRKAAPLPESVKQAPPPPVSVTAFKAPLLPPHSAQPIAGKSSAPSPPVSFALESSDSQAPRFRPARRPRGMSLSCSSRRSMESYDKICQVGGGTYGDVFKARDRDSGDIVALKKVRLDDEKEGFPVTALREIKFLSQVDHPNVVKLREVVSSKASEATRNKGSVYMVFEYAECDLVGLMKTAKLQEMHIMCLMKQLLEALHFAHKNHVLHRDIKPSNVLVNGQGILKLADWGLCRHYQPGGKYTNRVVTLWYRAPELLLGEQQYTSAVDMWAAGCLMAELLLGKPLLPGKDEVDQLKKVFELCGTPGKGNWPERWEGLPLAKDLQVINGEPTESTVNLRFGSLRPQARDLVLKMLELDPAKRISAIDALDHDYFWGKDIAPCDPSLIPVPKGDGLHEYQLREAAEAARQERKQQHDAHRHHDKKWKHVSASKQ